MTLHYNLNIYVNTAYGTNSSQNTTLVHHKRVRFHWRSGIVEGVRILGWLALQLTLVCQCAGATIAEKSKKKEWTEILARQYLINLKKKMHETKPTKAIFVTPKND